MIKFKNPFTGLNVILGGHRLEFIDEIKSEREAIQNHKLYLSPEEASIILSSIKEKGWREARIIKKLKKIQDKKMGMRFYIWFTIDFIKICLKDLLKEMR